MLTLLNSTIHSPLSALIGWHKSLAFIICSLAVSVEVWWVGNCFLTAQLSLVPVICYLIRASNTLITTQRYVHIWPGRCEVWDNTGIIIKLQFSRRRTTAVTATRVNIWIWTHWRLMKFQIPDTRCYVKYFMMFGYKLLMQIEWTWVILVPIISPSQMATCHDATLSNIPI